MGRSTVHYTDNETNKILKRLHNKLRPAGTPVERVEYIIELLLLRIFEAKIKQDEEFSPLRKLFKGENYRLLFSHLLSLSGNQILSELNKNIFPFYATILVKASKAVKGNLPTKMQDQLVLMQEVFSNSNFTNNVKGGVIAEVIGLVNEIEEEKILKTDLLGDAIESALSETGGTKDLGLFRTPDHIRKMMVEMVDPDFSDTIFDPACGTAGFLFDAYEYVIEKARKLRKFPPANIANQFYRTGIGGIEYQGRIRKMAAVNMYIRGLNPHNIEQGDSLKLYDPSADAGSKSVVIANPPFGAERDQPAYPNVWEEYSKESETTILFVKLMFDLLKKGGRCAVVVSEGFLTWGQNSSSALRKVLLQEANLKAIISLPQGVFVNKGGQGAKTSILYFEKGGPTDFVWHYKIENDGFSMGTNRKPIEGGQIPELLKLFKEVKSGKKPKDTKCSFCIPREWIETLDPRVAERIRADIKERITDKNTRKRSKEVEKLKKRLDTGKINQEIYKEKLWQFDNVVESKIENEVAKALEKSQNYHFNLRNYISSLSEEQIKDWRATLKGVKQKNNSTLEKRYQELQSSDINTALSIIASFYPRNALEMDIARDYLNKRKEKLLAELDDILRKSAKFPLARIGETCEIIKGSFPTKKTKPGLYPFVVTAKDRLSADSFDIDGKAVCIPLISSTGHGHASIKRLHYEEGKFALANIMCAVIPKDSNKLNAKYLFYVLTHKKDEVLVPLMKGAANVSMKPNDLLNVSFPLPSLEKQNEIVVKIDKQRQIIEGAEKVQCNWGFIDDDFYQGEATELGNHLTFVSSGSTPLGGKDNYLTSGVLFVRSQNVLKGKCDFSDAVYISPKIHEKMQRSSLQKKDVLLNITGASIGRSAVFNLEKEANVNQHVAILRTKKDILPEYLSCILNSPNLQNQINLLQNGASRQGLNFDQIKKLKIPLPSIEQQQKIFEKIDKQICALESLNSLKQEIKSRLEKILVAVWGE